MEEKDYVYQYEKWSKRFKTLCRQYPGMMDELEKDPSDATIDKKISDDIYACIDFLTDGIAHSKIEDVEEGHGVTAWNVLHSAIYKQTAGHISNINHQITNNKMHPTKDPTKFLNMMSVLFREISAIGFPIDASLQLIVHLIATLPESYTHLKTVFSFDDRLTMTVDELKEKICEHWQNNIRGKEAQYAHLVTSSQNQAHLVSGVPTTGGKGPRGKGKGKGGKGKGGKSKGKGKGAKGGRGGRTQQRNGDTYSAADWRATVQCHKCWKFGHIKPECQASACPQCGSFEHNAYQCPQSRFNSDGNLNAAFQVPQAIQPNLFTTTQVPMTMPPQAGTAMVVNTPGAVTAQGNATAQHAALTLQAAANGVGSRGHLGFFGKSTNEFDPISDETTVHETTVPVPVPPGEEDLLDYGLSSDDNNNDLSDIDDE